jgi:hypothetical protein
MREEKQDLNCRLCLKGETEHEAKQKFPDELRREVDEDAVLVTLHRTLVQTPPGF